MEAKIESLQPLHPPSLNSLIKDRLQRHIIDNELKSGDKLPSESELAERLQVSRTSIREALRGLEAVGLIESHRGRGRVVRNFSFDAILEGLSYQFLFDDENILQVLDIIRALHLYYLEKAMTNITEEDIAQLSEIVERMRRRNAAGLDAREESHDFYATLFRCAGNPLAAQLFDVLWAVRMHASDRGAAFLERDRPDRFVTLLEAIRRRDVRYVRELLVAYYARRERRFREVIANTRQGIPKGRAVAQASSTAADHAGNACDSGGDNVQSG